MSLLTLERPLATLMLIPILISIHITSKTYVRVISVLSIFLFSLGNILMNKEYIELWIISIYLIFYLVYKAKNLIKYSKDDKTVIANIDDYFIFSRDFSNDFNYDEYKNILLKNCTVKKFNKKKKLFTTEFGPFDKIFYFVIVPKSALLILKHQKVVISYLKKSSWIGVVEFITQMFNDCQRKWLVGLEIENPNEEEIVWLEWDKDYFHKVFRKYKSTSFLKRLLTNWIKYLSLSTYKMDDHIATALGVITHKKSYQLPEALPLFRHLSEINEEAQEQNLLLEEKEKGDYYDNTNELNV